jgi:hypothetical protein
MKDLTRGRGDAETRGTGRQKDKKQDLGSVLMIR